MNQRQGRHELRSGARIPIHSRGRTDRAPGKTSQRAPEESMVSIFRDPTQHTEAGGGAVALSEVNRGRKAILAKLPEEDLDFERDFSLSKPRGRRRDLAAGKLSVQGFDREFARARKPPRDRVRVVRQAYVRKQSPKAIPIRQLRPR